MRKLTAIIILSLLVLSALHAENTQPARNDSSAEIPAKIYEHLYSRLAIDNPFDRAYSGQKTGSLPATALSSADDEIVFSYNNSGLWNGMKDIKVEGNYAYCALDYGLLVLDISQISEPLFVSQIFMPDGDAWRIGLDGGFAFVADGYGGLQIVDISDPINPVLAGSLTTSRYCYDVIISGNYAFLADGLGGFLVADISDKHNPQQLTSLPLSGETVAISIEGNYAYLCKREAGFEIIDISDPLNPQEKGGLQDLGNMLDVEIKGNYAFLANEIRGILSVDISNPDEPFLASRRVSKSGALGITIKDDFAYVTYGSTSGLQVFDISDPIVPRHESSLLIPGSTIGVSTSGNYAFVAGWNSGLHIADITSPPQAFIAGSYFTRGSIESITADDEYFYIARSAWYVGKGSMQIIQMNENNIPEIISEVVLDGPAAMDIQVEGNYAYVTDVNNGLQIFDITDRLNPFITGSMPIQGHSLKMALSGNMAYIASDALGLVIIDISHKSSPLTMGQFDNQGFISGLAAAGDYVYLADETNGMQIIDVTNPAEPIPVSTVPTTGHANDVKVAGDYAYLVDDAGEFLVFNVTDPENPLIVRSLSDLENPVHIEIDDIFAYVSDVFYGIKAYNISNPAGTYLAGGYPTPGLVWDVSLVNGKAIIADYYGLLSLDIQRPELAFSPASLLYEGNQDGYQPDEQTLSIENIGAGSLVWNVSSSQTWLHMEPSSGTENAAITAGADLTGLHEGVYYDTIIISSNAINATEYLPVEFKINPPNSPPVFEELTDIMINENAKLTVTVVARDDDGTVPELAAEDLPINATFKPVGDGSGVFEFSPDFTQAGEYKVVFIAVDAIDARLVDTAIMPVTVVNVNRGPAFKMDIPDLHIIENDTVEITIKASDPDGDPITLTCTGKPDRAVFKDLSNGLGSFRFEPDYRDVGQTYMVIFAASDNLGGMSSDTIKATTTNRQLEIVKVDPNPPASGVKDILINEPIQITFNEGIDETSLEGNVSLESAKGGHLESKYDPDFFQLWIQSPTMLFEPLDTIYIILSKNITDRSGFPLTDAVERTFLTGTVVYSGDTDDNGVVDERDILPLGLHWQSTGPVRGENPDCEWGMSAAHQWDPLIATYADADGSGIVDADDICGLANNWEMDHAEKVSAETNDVDLMEALKQVDENILEDMFATLLNCSESRGKDALLKILGDMIKNNNAPVPTRVELDQNFPNPFNPVTTIRYSLETRRFVEIDIFNLSGQLVKSLESRVRDAGNYSVEWDGTDDNNSPASTGIYFYRLKTGIQTITKKMLLLK